MKKHYTSITVVLCLLFASFSTLAQNYSRIKVFADRSEMLSLYAKGFPMDDARSDIKGEWIVELSDSDLTELQDSGITFEVLIEDVSAFYVDRSKNVVPDLKDLSDEWVIPDGFSLGSIGGFCSIEEMISHLDSMIANYPDLISIKYQLDTNTMEDRPIYWVRISDNPNTNEAGEPEILYTGMHHAREPIGMQQNLFFMYWLLENYGSNEEATYLVDNFELIFVPIINMDGYAYNIQTNPGGGGMWRKTRRDNGDGSFGVDPNRNYDYQWGYDNVGSSPYPEDATYRGPFAFSEPCVIAMKNFCEANDFKVALNYHSHGNLLLYAWGWSEDPCDDDAVYHAHSVLMTEENGYTYGPGSLTIYPTNGGSDDWMYGEQETKNKILAYTPELGNSNDGFWPSVSRIIPLCQENVLQNILAAKLAGAWATVEDISPSIIEETTGQFYFGVERLGLNDAGVYNVSITPVNDAISVIGDPMAFHNMDILEYQGGSITYELKPDIVAGEEIIYLLSVDNGMITQSDTIVKVYGSSVAIFQDDGESFEKWMSNDWNITTSFSHSPEHSIADSPYGQYGNYANTSMVLLDPIDLTTTTYAVLNFWAKWDIEAGYDYVQVFVNGTGGGDWTPLKGKFTKTGNSNQATGEPLYDGVQEEWVKEEIILTDYVGEEILLRFRLKSDTYVTGDGYFWDDMTVTIVDDFTNTDEMAKPDIYSLTIYPNPVINNLNIRYDIATAGDTRLEVYNAQGQIMDSRQLISGSHNTSLSVSGWPSGIYFCRVVSKGKTLLTDKFVK